MQREADNPIRTTEWEDIQYEFGNRVGKYETHEAEILQQKAAKSQLNKNLVAYDPEKEKQKDREERTVDKSESVGGSHEEAPDSDDDDFFLAKMRQQRLDELKKRMQDERFGVLRSIPGSEYVKEITEDSARCWVVAILVQPGHSDCEALLTVMRTVAQRQKSIKFVSMLYTEAIDKSFPQTLLPCVLLYHEKKLQQQLTGAEHWRKRREVSVRYTEHVLKRFGVPVTVESSEEEVEED